MSKRVMLVTGGSRGIGAATAKLAAQEGYHVCLTYENNQAAAEEVVSSIEAFGGNALAVRSDVSDERQVEELFQDAIRHFGAIDCLVNNAAILLQQSTLDSFTADRVRRILEVNVLGSILCAREAVRHMSTKNGGKGGSIVNLSSAAARLGSPNEYIDYAASKGAIDTMTVGLAKEVAAQGIRVNGIRPGAIHTDIHAAGGEPNRIDRLKPNIPLGRGGETHEIAHAILWLASEQATYATGAILDVTGGI